MRQAQEAEQKKVAQEMFAMSSHLTEVEERLRDTQAADRTKAEVIRDMKAEHQAELETLSHSSRLSSRQQVSSMATGDHVYSRKTKGVSLLLIILTDNPHTCQFSTGTVWSLLCFAIRVYVFTCM